MTLLFFSVKMKAGLSTMLISVSCCTYPSLYKLNICSAYSHKHYLPLK